MLILGNKTNAAETRLLSSRIVYDDGMLEVFRSGVKRDKYRFHFQAIETVAQLKATLRAGAYAWPGGYPLYLLTSDGETLSFDAARSEFRQIAYAIRHKLNDGWRVVACDVNYEDADMVCAHTGERIESAYE